jgi:PBSX family phage terminase large subunit
MKAPEEGLRVSGCVAPAYREAFRAAMEDRLDTLTLRGGRNSGKSTFAALLTLLAMNLHRDRNAVVVRKVAATLRHTVMAQYVQCLDMLGIRGKCSVRYAPMQISFLGTRQKIVFLGADDPGNIRGIKPDVGYFAILHAEEANQFASRAELRDMATSALRGGPAALEIDVYNPPRFLSHWINRERFDAGARSMTVHTTFRDVPAAWTTDRMRREAEALEERNPDAFRNEFLGEAVAFGGAVFPNAQRWSGDVEIDEALCGVDWGFFPDPWA